MSRLVLIDAERLNETAIRWRLDAHYDDGKPPLRLTVDTPLNGRIALDVQYRDERGEWWCGWPADTVLPRLVLERINEEIARARAAAAITSAPAERRYA